MPVSLRDIRFIVHDVLDFAGHYARLGPRADGTQVAEPPDRVFIDAVLDEGYRFTEQELAPLAQSGDALGCRFDDGRVHVPPGFREAYATYVAGGWAGLNGNPEYGGQGLPDSLSLFFEDLMSCANMAWAMYPGLSRGVIGALTAHGTAQQKRDFLPHLLSGTWTGTMCLTEPHAGSDVGLARTRAEPRADGTWSITGTKIFISAGEHDLAENIVHLVLARVPDAPDGTRGISMFVVPKFDLDGTRNAVTCAGIEDKMGLHGNATCVLDFDGARGYLVGEVNRGMRYMFTMMNAARLVVGLQGCTLAHAAFLKSAAWARERLQMRALSGPVAPERPADPIIVHPDVRRMLLTQRAIAEGGRMLVYYAGQIADLTVRAPSEADRAAADVLLDFLTPIVKGVLTELAFESVNHAVQIHGGHGYIRGTGIEQYVRDARITLIYEGTTQIQGLDLLGRKILQTQGRGLIAFVGEMQALADRIAEPLPELAEPLRRVAQEWSELTMALGGKALGNIDEVGAAAVDYLMYSGYAALAYCWARMAAVAAAGPADDPFLAGKLATARFYFQRLLPRTGAHKAALESGAAALTGIDEVALTEL
jgi:alkylation response protein AidB-like acyl-CoA dehydrogenase